MNARIIPTPEEWVKREQAYIEQCEAKKEPVTMAGMARFMGFASRQSFHDYEKIAEFKHCARRTRLLIEEEYEKKLTTMGRPTGAIFALKNMGWQDRLDHLHGAADPSDIAKMIRGAVKEADERTGLSDE